MKLAPLIGKKYKQLQVIIEQYNNADDKDNIEKLYYLQKLSSEIYKYDSVDSLDRSELFVWLNSSGEISWEANLKFYSIHPQAPFYLQNYQFAEAVNKAKIIQTKAEPVKAFKALANSVANLNVNNESGEWPNTKQQESKRSQSYKLLQKRDELLKSDVCFSDIKEQYTAVSTKLLLSKTPIIKEKIERVKGVLSKFNYKINGILDRDSNPSDELEFYTTPFLGNFNNKNFKLEVSEKNESGQSQKYVIRVQCTRNLPFEQDLWSHEFSKYFIEEYALFYSCFKDQGNKESPVRYHPTVISQHADEGSLLDVALKLNGKDDSVIATQANYYFKQLSEFCNELMKDGFYHSDIKLTNILLHKNYRIQISDRKTIAKGENPVFRTIRTSLSYSPPEYYEGIMRDQEGNLKIKPGFSKKNINIHQFMAYQVGIALKEFLMLSYLEQDPKDYFFNPGFDVAKHLNSQSLSIQNLSELAQALTHPEPNQRLSIKDFKSLLNCLLQSRNLKGKIASAISTEEGYDGVAKVDRCQYLFFSQERQPVATRLTSYEGYNPAEDVNNECVVLEQKASPLEATVLTSYEYNPAEDNSSDCVYLQDCIANPKTVKELKADNWWRRLLSDEANNPSDEIVSASSEPIIDDRLYRKLGRADTLRSVFKRGDNKEHDQSAANGPSEQISRFNR